MVRLLPIRFAACFCLAVPVAAFAIPPSLPGDAARQQEQEERRAQIVRDIESPEGELLVESFFEFVANGEPFNFDEIFARNATFVANGEVQVISDATDDDGFPNISQWTQISKFRLTGSWATAARRYLSPGFWEEAVLKFFFDRDDAGNLRIVRIEKVDL